MQHPSNPWYPSPWFTRDYGFMSPTPMYWPENGKNFHEERNKAPNLRYRVLVHSGDHLEAEIAQEFRKVQITEIITM